VRLTTYSVSRNLPSFPPYDRPIYLELIVMSASRQHSTHRPPRLTTWLEWYRFARSQLDLGHEEAVTYANVRTVEDGNRERLRERRAA
jgi:hypothetical protein